MPRAPKSRKNVASFFINAVGYIYSQNTLGLNMEAPNLCLAPGAI